MTSGSNKAAFVRHADPNIFARVERRKRNWMKHSVAVLVLSPRVDQVALVLPQKAADRGADNVRVPPQQKLLPTDMVQPTAAKILRELLTIHVPNDDMLYLGTGRGNAHRGGQSIQYGKWVHWVGVHLGKTRGVFNQESDRFQFAHWCSANHLLAMDRFAMSDRKYMLTLQAITAFNALGAEGKIIKKARDRLRAA